MTLLPRRKALGLTQDNIAEKMNVDRSTVSKWETGEFLPSSENLIKLAVLCNCTIDDLLAHKGTIPGKEVPDNDQRLRHSI